MNIIGVIIIDLWSSGSLGGVSELLMHSASEVIAQSSAAGYHAELLAKATYELSIILSGI